MCGESMRLHERTVQERRPAQSGLAARTLREWVCPGCDYFEEADEGEK
jgi:hypothetical protein